jgi:hypothetical protein
MSTTVAEDTATVAIEWPHGMTLGVGALAGMTGRQVRVNVGTEQYPSTVVRIERKADRVLLELTVPPMVAALLAVPDPHYSIGFTPEGTP